MDRRVSCRQNKAISACTQSCLAGGTSDARIAEMCNVLLYSMQLMEPYNSRIWLKSGLLGSRTEEPYLLASIDISMQTAHWLYAFRVCTIIYTAAVSCLEVSLDLTYLTNFTRVLCYLPIKLRCSQACKIHGRASLCSSN